MTTLRQEKKSAIPSVNTGTLISPIELIEAFIHALKVNDEIAEVCRLLPIINDTGKVPERLLEDKSDFVKQQVSNILTTVQLEQFETNKQSINDSESQKQLQKCLLKMSKDHYLLLLIILQRFLRIYQARSTQKITLRIKNQAKFFIAVYQSLLSMLGIRSFTSVIEDTCFAVMSPKVYSKISAELEENWPQTIRDVHLQNAVVKVNTILESKGISATVTARVKSILGIWRKKRKLKLNKFPTDILGLRIIVESKLECYQIMDMLHKDFEYLPTEFDDYIRTPKVNEYQSIHTVLLWKFEHQVEKVAVEVQIRTHQMDEIAKYGAAAHRKYKQGYIFGERLEQKLISLSEIYAEKNNAEFDKQQVAEQLKLNILVYTANKEMKTLPENSSVLDFAYYIHTEIGDKFDSAVVNNKLVNIDAKLRHGDIVKINTSDDLTVTKTWLTNKYATTTRAKKYINLALRSMEN